MITLNEPVEFIWDKGNVDKNWLKHKITNRESEEVFFDRKKRIAEDKFHSDKEERYIVLGKTKGKRLLFIVFTLRDKKVRIISARDTNKKERILYEKTA
ncbi:MAG: BrnT family toxin [Patescibacteria group bacterium]